MEKDEKQTEEVEVNEQEQQQQRFSKYRDAYLRERLRAMNVKEGAETDAALKFIDERADENDSNLDQVFDDLKVRMRLEQRVNYVDPSPMNFAREYPAQVDLREVGRQMYRNLKRKGRL